MRIVEHLKKSKILLLDAIEDIRYRMYFGEDRSQSTVSLKDKLKTPVRDLAVLLCIIAVVALCVMGVVRAYGGYAYGLYEHRIDGFEENESHFELLANEVYEYYTAKHEYNEGCGCLYIYPVNAEFHVYYVYDDPTQIKNADV